MSTPILLPRAAGEHLVYCTPFNRVIALDPATGTERWSYDPQVPRTSERPYRCRGVAYAEVPQAVANGACRHRIYTATNDRRLIALDARDGKPCEQFGERGEVELVEHERYGLEKVSSSSPPVVANGVVVVGSSVIDFAYAEAPRGVIAAFDAATGAPRWAFDPLAGVSGTGAGNAWAPLARINPVVEEVLYPAMEDFFIDVMIGEGPSARSIKLNLEHFTLIGATTKQGLLGAPFRDRFGILSRLDLYSPDELLKIVTRSASILKIPITVEGADEIARRSRGTPRIVNRLLRRVRDYAMVRGDGTITREITARALQMMQIDELGLVRMLPSETVQCLLHRQQCIRRSVAGGEHRVQTHASSSTAVFWPVQSASPVDQNPAHRLRRIGGFRFGLIHGWGSPRGLEERVLAQFNDVDVVVYGHSH